MEFETAQASKIVCMWAQVPRILRWRSQLSGRGPWLRLLVLVVRGGRHAADSRTAGQGDTGAVWALMAERRAVQEKGFDTVDANRELGFDDDCREYTSVFNILADLGVPSIKLMVPPARRRFPCMLGFSSAGCCIR